MFVVVFMNCDCDVWFIVEIHYLLIEENTKYKILENAKREKGVTLLSVAGEK